MLIKLNDLKLADFELAYFKLAYFKLADLHNSSTLHSQLNATQALFFGCRPPAVSRHILRNTANSLSLTILST